MNDRNPAPAHSAFPAARLILQSLLPLLLSLILSFLPAVGVRAQETTGTIRGHVVNAATDEPLSPATITLYYPNRTQVGVKAVTDTSGEYVISGLQMGFYMVRARSKGFIPSTFHEVIVRAGSISVVRDFRLLPRIERPISAPRLTVPRLTVEPDTSEQVIQSRRGNLTADRITETAAYTTTEILSLQTGFLVEKGFQYDVSDYYSRGLQQLRTRGGRYAEAAFMIDGIQITNPVFGGQALEINPFALEEMVIMTSGMNAEFGNALSGVVNFVTKEGGSSWSGNVEVLSSEFSGFQQDDARDMTRTRGFVGGPVPFSSGLSFLLSGSATTQKDYLVEKDRAVFDLNVIPFDPTTRRPEIDYYQMPEDWSDWEWGAHNPYAQKETITGHNWRLHPLDIYAGWLGYGFNNGWDALATLSQRLDQDMKMSISWTGNSQLRAPYNPSWRYSMFWGLPEKMENNCVWGTERWECHSGYPGYPSYSQLNNIISGTGLTDFHNEKNIVRSDHDRFTVVWTHQTRRSTFYSIKASYFDYSRIMRVRRWVNEEGYVPRFEHLYPSGSAPEDTLWHWGDPMTQVTLEPLPYSADDSYDRRYGYVQIGGAGLGNDGSDRYYTNQNDITRTVKFDITSQISPHYQIKGGIGYRSLSLDAYDVELLYLTPPEINQYRRKPSELGIYLENRIEYRYMVLNAGLRYDEIDTAIDVPWYIDWGTPMDEYGKLITDNSGPFRELRRTGGKLIKLSPRVSISHPINSRAVIFGNYGHYYQTPLYQFRYRPIEDISSRSEFYTPLKGERSIIFEVGLHRNLDTYHTISTVVWGKDMRNLVSSETIPAFYQGVSNPYTFTVFSNKDHALVRGVDFSISRRFNGIWSGRLDYSFMLSEANREDPWAGLRGGDEPETGPKRERVVGWDQPHNIRGYISLQLPEGFGPEINGTHPFERLSASIHYLGSAGRPYTPTMKERELEPYSGRMPWTHQWDLRIYRDFRFTSFECSAIVHIRNLFNRRNVMVVFSKTGKPDDPGQGTTGYSDEYDRSWYYRTPRTIDLGFRIRF